MCTAARAPLSGEATYYAADGSGNCSFAASSDHLVAAINAPDYMMASWCGACVAVTGPMGEVTVRIVDKCPGCAHGDLDLSEEAFARISPLSAGRVAITWREVACDVTGPIKYQWKNGSNAFYAAIQLRNHRYPIAKLEAQNAGGTYDAIARVEYNYFVDTTGLGAGPFALRVTDTRGHVLEDTAIALGDDVERSGAAQFPVCP
jgi:expansin (peptidoglycan-binding protein)